MPKHTVPAKGGALTAKGHDNQPDPVAEIGAKLAVASRAIEEVQKAINKVDERSAARSDLNADEEVLHDYVEALLDLALSLPAKSAAGALVQLSVISRHLDRREPEGPDVTDRRIEFGIGSIAGVLAEIAGVDPETLHRDFGRNVIEQPARFGASLDAEGGE